MSDPLRSDCHLCGRHLALTDLKPDGMLGWRCRDWKACIHHMVQEYKYERGKYANGNVRQRDAA